MHGDGEHLGLVLEHFGILQKDAAAAVGVDPAMVTRWKRGTERLAVDSPRMTALVDFVLAPNRGIDETDVRWLRGRFAEAGVNTRFTDVAGLREALTDYLANDGSRLGEKDRERRQLYQQDQFAVGGLTPVIELVRGELLRMGEGSPLYVVSAGCGIEEEPAFAAVLSAAVQRGVRLHLLLGDAQDQPGDRCAGSRLTQACLPLMFSPSVLVRYTPMGAACPLMPTFSTTMLIPGRLCLHLSGAHGSAEPVVCGIRQRGYLQEVERSLSRLWVASEAAFENPREATPRFVSGRMTHFLRSGTVLRVASDGLNPLFMDSDSFDRLLERQGVDETERAWRVEAFAREQDAFERRIASGGAYREMTTAVDTSLLRGQGAVTVYGPTFVGMQLVDIPAALQILQGYLRFATLYPQVDLRFANPSRELADGLWMLSDASGPHDESAAGLIRWQWVEQGVRQLVSYHPRIRDAVREAFDDAWTRFRFRVWDGNGVLETGGGSTDPSVTVHLIREKIRELEELQQHRDR